MSRVDDALRALEGVPRDDRTPVVTGAPRPAERFKLSQYSREGPPAPDHAFRPKSRDLESPAPLALGRRTPLARKDIHPEGRLVTGATTHHASLEQYRRLAATLHDVQIERGLKTVMVTSSVPREGKTLTAVNLALTLSESYGRRVLLIDADLRWPSVHEVLGIPNEIGLCEALRDGRRDLSLAQVWPRLSVLPSGQLGSRPLAGLTSERMGTLLEECASQFDWVLLDTPPVGLLPDGQLLARLTKAVVFVIAARSTPASVVERALAELAPECLVGAVLNRVEERLIPDISYYSTDGDSATSATSQ